MSTELINAVENEYPDEVKRLLEKGADVHTFNEFCLRFAWSRQYYDISKLLIEYGANLTIQNNDLAKKAVNFNQLDFVKLFMENIEIDPNTDYGITKAIELGHLDIVKYFILECHQNINLITEHPNVHKIDTDVLDWVLAYKNSLKLKNKLENMNAVIINDRQQNKKNKI